MLHHLLQGRNWFAPLCGVLSLLMPVQSYADEATTIKDLHYGETLYHFYQGKYFSAISDLMIAQKQHPIKTQGNDPEILLGGLFLSYDMSRYADTIFKNLIKNEQDQAIQATAWYYLARLSYQRGNYQTAKKYMAKVSAYLPYRYNDESQHLDANISLKLQDYPAAIKTLSNFSGKTEWLHYARFNLAMALAKTGDRDQAIQLLKEVARIKPATVEQTALRDKANLALGYTELRNKNASRATRYFKKIRLLGTQSNKALLGIGWAHHHNGDFEDSLVPWLELQKRLTTDPAVQEAMLTVPYTLEKLASKQQALAYYNFAIDTYNAEKTNLDKVIKAVSTGEFIKALRTLHSHQSKENHLHYTTLPKSVATPYLHQIIAGNTFQAALKNYRDLLFMQNTLAHWENQIPTYQLMLDERKRAYKNKLKTARQSLKQAQQHKLDQQYTKLNKQLARISQQDNVLALATPDEKDLLKIISKARKRLKRAGKIEDLSAQADRLRFYYGLLYWQISDDFPERRWQVQKGLNEINKLLAEQNKRKQALQAALTEPPGKFNKFARQIADKQKNLKQIRGRLNRELGRQEKYITAMALSTLREQKRKLENYHIRASYSLTRLYDSFAAVEKKP